MIGKESNRTVRRLAWALTVTMVFAGIFVLPRVQASPGDILILDPTVTGGAGSVEAVQAAALGFTVDVVSAATWSGMTTAQFAAYKAIVLGDPTCVTGTSPIAAAELNIAAWGPAITGNVVVIGTDPVYHQSQGGTQLTNSGIAFAADEPGETGAYITLSCYYYAAASGTAVPLLDAFSVGGFTVVGQGGCPANSHIVATHPALVGLTDADLSNWGCSTHEGFVTWPSDFLVLAISLDVPSTFCAADGTCGAPYIVARGEELTPLVQVHVTKDFRYTNVDFPTCNFGIPLPNDHLDWLVGVVVSKTNIVLNTNPGQLYAVETITGAGISTALVTDTFGSQFNVNPPQAPGGVTVLVYDPSAAACTVADLTKAPGTFVTVDNQLNTVTVYVNLTAARGSALTSTEQLLVFKKFGPSPQFKGQPWTGTQHFENAVAVETNLGNAATAASIHLDKK